jgi:hypothetical protein
MGNLQKMTAE